MTTEKQFPALSDFQITETMIEKGGGFVSRLGQLFRYADDSNRAILKEAFVDYWETYADATARCPECGRTEIVKCEHQWGHT